MAVKIGIVDSSMPNFTPTVKRVAPVGQKKLKIALSNVNIGN